MCVVVFSQEIVASWVQELCHIDPIKKTNTIYSTIGITNFGLEPSDLNILLPNSMEEPVALCGTIFDGCYWITKFNEVLSKYDSNRNIGMDPDAKTIEISFRGFSKQAPNPSLRFYDLPSTEREVWPKYKDVAGRYTAPFYVFIVKNVPPGSYALRFSYMVKISSESDNECNFIINGPRPALEAIEKKLSKVPDKERPQYFRWFNEARSKVQRPQYDIITFGDQEYFTYATEGTDDYRPKPQQEIVFHPINPPNLQEHKNVSYRLFYPQHNEFSILLKAQSCGKLALRNHIEEKHT